MSSTKRPLQQARPGSVALGQSTIMDRDLAAQHGVPYVHLSAFAIDVDRVFVETPDSAALPLGWEVALCLGYVLGRIDTAHEELRNMVEDTCLHILSFAPGEAPLGSELAFATYCGVQLQLLPSELGAVFRAWKRKPKQLVQAVEVLFADNPDQALATFANHCLQSSLPVPLSPPSLDTLQAMSQRRLPLAFVVQIEDINHSKDQL